MKAFWVVWNATFLAWSLAWGVRDVAIGRLGLALFQFCMAGFFLGMLLVSVRMLNRG